MPGEKRGVKIRSEKATSGAIRKGEKDGWGRREVRKKRTRGGFGGALGCAWRTNSKTITKRSLKVSEEKVGQKKRGEVAEGAGTQRGEKVSMILIEGGDH